jgi:hypothetical protein
MIDGLTLDIDNVNPLIAAYFRLKANPGNNASTTRYKLEEARNHVTVVNGLALDIDHANTLIPAQRQAGNSLIQGNERTRKSG